MSNLITPSKGLFFGSALFNQKSLSFLEIKKEWEKKFSPSVEFHHSFFPMKDYYSKEMGDKDLLSRVILLALLPDDREKLVDHKLWADDLEKKIDSTYSYRALNLDIGLLTLENLTLATGKNFSHRIYLGRGVFSDLNYKFEKKTFVPLPWCYPDYAHPDFIHFFNWARGHLLRKVGMGYVKIT